MQIIPKKPISSSVKIAFSFLVSGIALFVVSVFLVSQIVGIIGLGLIFWGALFLLITPLKYVEGNFLITSTLPAYMTIDRMLKDLNPKNEAYNIPSLSQKCLSTGTSKRSQRNCHVHSSKRLNGMAEISEIEDDVEDKFLFENPKELLISIARDKFLIENPKGLLITSPGIGLLDKIEQKRNKDLTKIPPIRT